MIFRDTEAVRKITTVLNRNYEELLACSRVQPGELLREGGTLTGWRRATAVASTRVIGQHDSSTCLRETEAHTKRLHQDAVHLLGYRKTRPEGQR